MNMMKCVAQRSKRKYIDADVIEKYIQEVRDKLLIQAVFSIDMEENAIKAGVLEAVRSLLDILPAADVAEIVRCKDCKYAHMTMDGECKYCDIWFPDEKKYMDGNYYCASWERKDE